MRLLGWKLLLLSLVLTLLVKPIYSYSPEIEEETIIRYNPEGKNENVSIKSRFRNFPKAISKNDEEIGNQGIFWSLDVLGGLYVQKRATLLSVGEKCYIYMANETIEDIGQSTAINNCNYYRDEFDVVIYDKNIEFMGHPDGRIGDIDGDPKVTVLIVPLNGAGGVYLQKDDIPDSTYSNHREMVYIDSSMGERIGGLMTLMHEFNHLIWFNNEMDEGHFLLEGAAEFAIYYAGYLSTASNYRGINLTWHTNNFIDNHQRSLLSFHLNNRIPLSEEYGKAYLFMLYLVEQFGIDFLRNLVLTLPDGPLGIDSALNSSGYNVRFNEVFLNWITTCTIDNEIIANGIYGFNNVDFVVNSDEIVDNYPHQKKEMKHYPYGFHVKKLINPPDNFTFQITNPYPTHSLGISIAINDQNGWQVIKTTYSEIIETINIFISGKNINEAFILTTLISENTPDDFLDFINVGEESFYLLDYSIVEGHIQTTKMNCISIGFVLGFIVVLSIVRKRRNLKTIQLD